MYRLLAHHGTSRLVRYWLSTRTAVDSGRVRKQAAGFGGHGHVSPQPAVTAAVPSKGGGGCGLSQHHSGGGSPRGGQGPGLLLRQREG